jgi:predicted RNA-binding Zn-ribbon protein involved in translation (DUF1610 family)
MGQNIKRGAWSIRLFIRLFTVVLGVLFFWLLGFVLEDIGSIKGPDYAAVEKQYIDQSLLEKARGIREQVQKLERAIANKREQQGLVGASSQNLKQTIDQLADLQRQSIQKQVVLSDSDKERMSISLKQYLANQNNYQELNQDLLSLTSQKNQPDTDQQEIDKQVEKQRKTARGEYDKMYEAHRMRLAFYQLAILAPLFLIAGYLVFKRRDSVYYPLFLAVGGATALKVALVMHEYIPPRYTKYVLILVLLGVTARILVHFIKIAAFPKLDWLLRQYREAYERFLCPVCEYPIRTGPRKYLYWTRRTVNRTLPQGDAAGKEEPYTCPACGATLYEQCPSCQKIRHSLLEHCEHCGTKKAVQGSSTPHTS